MGMCWLVRVCSALLPSGLTVALIIFSAYMCERHQVTNSDLQGSCLGSLYLLSALSVARNCKINRILLNKTVYQILNNNYIVFTPYPITTQSSCFNGSNFQLKILNTQQVRIPEGCQVELNNHSIQLKNHSIVSPHAVSTCIGIT
jgi:hypothetical protein